jgi:hypothetical protein
MALQPLLTELLKACMELRLFTFRSISTWLTQPFALRKNIRTPLVWHPGRSLPSCEKRPKIYLSRALICAASHRDMMKTNMVHC